MSKKLFQLHPDPDPEPTFDRIFPLIQEWLQANPVAIKTLLNDADDWLLVNRDLNGRVRLILPQRIESQEEARGLLLGLYQSLATRLGAHAHPVESGALFEASRVEACTGATLFPLQGKVEGFDNIWLADRLATESNWVQIEPETQGAPRIVFYSVKGGVGRSTALAACAWWLAQAGKRVLVLDLDLESPGLSHALLPTERQPMFGITDWLVEDLVDNGPAVFDSMVATSNLAHDGEIHIVPAHGQQHGEYIAKLGRVWMPKIRKDGSRETWSARMQRLLQALEARIKPDVVLIDSRSGIDEIASACITDIGASLILLFAQEGGQTWNGYRVLFEQWQRAQVTQNIRERLQIVAALVPELDQILYLTDLRENAYDVFLDTLYDEIAPSTPAAAAPTKADSGKWHVSDWIDGWSFDVADEAAPHTPWVVNWHRSLAGLRSLRGHLADIDRQQMYAVFGSLLDGVGAAVATGARS